MSNNDIPQLMELIYNMIYKNNEKTNEEYYYKKFIPANITLADLIKNNDFDKSAFLTSNAPKDFKIISANPNHFVTVKKYLPKFPATIIIQPFNKETQNTLNIVDIYYELFMNQIVSEFTFVEHVPFYLINLCNFVVPAGKSGIDVKELLEKSFDGIEESRKICVSVYEHFHSYCSLRELFTSCDLSSAELANIFFQIFFSYAYLQYKLGVFRHNAFDMDCFLVQKNNLPTLDLRIEDMEYGLKDVKHVLKLHRFRKSQMQDFPNSDETATTDDNGEEIVNSRTINPDPSYDVYVMLKSIYMHTKTNIRNFENVKAIISNFISLLFIEEHDGIMDEDLFYSKYLETIIPAQVLSKNNFFEKFIKMPRYGGKIIKGGNKNYNSVTFDSDKRFMAHKVDSERVGGMVISKGGYEVEDESETTTDDEEDVEHNDDTSSTESSATSASNSDDESSESGDEENGGDDDYEHEKKMKESIKENADEIVESQQDEAENEQAETPIDGDNNDTDDIEEMKGGKSKTSSKRREKLLKELKKVEEKIAKEESKKARKVTRSYGDDSDSVTLDSPKMHHRPDETTLTLDEFVNDMKKAPSEIGGSRYRLQGKVNGIMSDMDERPLTDQELMQLQQTGQMQQMGVPQGMPQNALESLMQNPQLQQMANSPMGQMMGSMMGMNPQQHGMMQPPQPHMPPMGMGMPHGMGLGSGGGRGELPLVTKDQAHAFQTGAVNIGSNTSATNGGIMPFMGQGGGGGSKNSDNFFFAEKTKIPSEKCKKYKIIRGGTGRVIPQYIEPANSPYSTNNQKEVEQQNNAVPPPPQPDAQIADKPAVPQGRSYIPKDGENVNENVNVEVTVEESKKPDKKGENKPKPAPAPYANNPNPKPPYPPKQYAPRPPQQQGNNPANNPPNVKQNLSAVPAGLPLQQFNVTTPYLPPQYQAQFDTFLRNMYVPFIYNDYHIGGVKGPNDNHMQASMIYEDALPAATVYTTFASLKERNSLCKYARSMFIKMEDGEDVDFNGGETSLNSRLKLIELNPYSTNYFSNNPYKGLPAGLLIYRSCYPIMYDNQKSTVECRKSSVGLNVRIYKVTVDEYRTVNPNFQMPINKNQGLSYLPSAINYSQNLPQYTPLQYIPPDAKQVLSINDVVNSQIPRTKTIFEAINAPVVEDFYMGIPKYVPNTTTNTIMVNPVPEAKIAGVIPKINKVINSISTGTTATTAPVTVSIKTDIIDPKTKYDYDVWREVGYYQFIRDTICKPMVCPNFVQSYCYFICQSSDFNFEKNTMNNYTNSMIAAAKSKIESSKKAIVILTESPNYNVYTWASNSYVRQNNIKKQTYTGYKPDNVWLVILAQVMIVFYVMFKYNFTFNDMIFQNNFYIKDMNATTGDSQKFWIYRIDGFDYYLPNYGHLLLCDSDYHDLDTLNTRKIIGEPFYNSAKAKPNDDETPHVHETIMENAYKCTNNILGPEFTQVNGVQPSGDVMNILTMFNDTVGTKKNEIKTGLSATPATFDVANNPYRVAYKEILHDNLKRFLHNRVGTVLRDNEVNYIRKEDPKPPKIGSMMVNEYQVDKYRFVIFKSYVDEETETAYCYAKANFNVPTPTAIPEIIVEKVNKSQLYNYSENISIKPDAKPDEPAMGLDYILETYII